MMKVNRKYQTYEMYKLALKWEGCRGRDKERHIYTYTHIEREKQKEKERGDRKSVV